MADREKLIELMFVGQVLADAECDKQAECNKCPYSAPNACRVGFVADHLIDNGVTFAEDNNVPGKWIPVTERLPQPGERVLATDGGFVGEFYINKRGQWQRYNVNDSSLLMALDILWWMPLPQPPKGECV